VYNRPPKFSCYTILYVLLLYVSYGDRMFHMFITVCHRVRQPTNNSMILCSSTNHTNTPSSWNFGRLQKKKKKKKIYYYCNAY